MSKVKFVLHFIGIVFAVMTVGIIVLAVVVNNEPASPEEIARLEQIAAEVPADDSSALIRAYRDLKDADPGNPFYKTRLRELGRQAKIEQLEKEAYVIPAYDSDANIKAYERLVKVDPNNERYRNKVAQYKRQKKDHAAAAQAQKEEDEYQAIMERARNYKPTPEQKAQNEKYAAEEAWKAAKKNVLLYLKYPETASFGGAWGGQTAEHHTNKITKSRFKCWGWVESQNALGQKVKSNFICVVKYMGMHRWEIVEMDVQ